MQNLLLLGGLGALGYWLTSASGKNSNTDLTMPSAPSASFTRDAVAQGVSGHDFVLSLPDASGPDREQKILDAIDRGLTVDASWCPIVSNSNGHTLAMLVMGDALSVGNPDDFVRVDLTHRSAELLGRQWGGVYICTSKIADMTFQQADASFSPSVLTGDPAWLAIMSTTRAMLEFNARVELKRAGRTGLLSDVGKFWVNSARLGSPDAPTQCVNGGGPAAANYGFFGGNSKGPGGVAVWQNVGLAHNLAHTDYSQTVRFVGAKAVLDNSQVVDIWDIARDPELCSLVSDEGVVWMHHPGIPDGWGEHS